METIIVSYNKAFAPEIKRIRQQVFVEEQQIDPKKVFDGEDGDAVHVLLRKSGQFVGSGRMMGDGQIGRLAVLQLHRGNGYGAAMVRALIDAAAHRRLKRVYLGSQRHAVGFYKKLGFSICGDTYIEADIEHVPMEISPNVA